MLVFGHIEHKFQFVENTTSTEKMRKGKKIHLIQHKICPNIITRVNIYNFLFRHTVKKIKYKHQSRDQTNFWMNEIYGLKPQVFL